MNRKGECKTVWKSNSFVTAAEQLCFQPVLEHRQRRGRRNIAWQAIPHRCSSNRKGTTSDSWPTTGRNVKLFSGGGREPASVRHVGDTCEWRRQVRWCGAMQSTIRQRRHLECNSLRHAEPMKADERLFPRLSKNSAGARIRSTACCTMMFLIRTTTSCREIFITAQPHRTYISGFQASEPASCRPTIIKVNLSSQFAINKTVYKIFGAMSKDLKYVYTLA